MSRSAEKIERGDSLVSPGMVSYAEKQVKPFWSSSLGQMVQFDTIIFCRTFENYFGQFVWIEKKRVTIIVAFHFMKRRLKIPSAGEIIKEFFDSFFIFRTYFIWERKIFISNGFFIFRPYFIWEWKIFKPNRFLFTKFTKHEFYIHLKGRYP